MQQDPNILAMISRPAAGLSQIGNALYQYGADKEKQVQQNRLNQIQDQQIAEESKARDQEMKARKLQMMQQVAPAMVNLFSSTAQLPPEQRAGYLQQNKQLFDYAGIDMAQMDATDVTDEGLQKLSGVFSPFVKSNMTPYQRESLDIQRQRLDKDPKAAKNAVAPAGVREFEYYQKLKKTNPEEAAAFGRERGFISTEGQALSSHLQKRLSLATDEAVSSETNANQYNLLASEIEKADVGGGLISGKWGEKLKDISGNQDEVTNLRRRYMGIRASQVVKNLPPGAASDADVALALSGFPTDNASGKQISSFLKGVAKIEAMNAEFNNFKAEYISTNGNERNLLSEWKKSKSPDGQPKDATQQVKLSDDDRQAVEWARNNPNDPRAKQILKMQGSK